MIRWEPVKGEQCGFAIFDHGTKREYRMVLNSIADFEYLERVLEGRAEQAKALAYLDAANHMRKFAQDRTGTVPL